MCSVKRWYGYTRRIITRRKRIKKLIKGAELFVKAPEIFYRDCNDCKKYIYHNGVPVLRDNKKIERPIEMPVNCTVCEKWIDEDKHSWQGFSSKNEYIFKSFRLCYYFGILPAAGGTDKQDPVLMDRFLLLLSIFKSKEDLDRMQGINNIIRGMKQ